MINEETLINILEAADFTDPEDLRIRTLLIAALRNIRVDFSGLMRRPILAPDGRHSPPID
jgi:hypothetical protein